MQQNIDNMDNFIYIHGHELSFSATWYRLVHCGMSYAILFMQYIFPVGPLEINYTYIIHIAIEQEIGTNMLSL